MKISSYLKHCIYIYVLLDTEADNRYQFRQDNSTISSLVQQPGDRRNPDNPYTVDSRRTGDNPYESTKITGGNQYTTTDNRQEIDRRNTSSDYTRRAIPTADVFVDPYRRPSHGNARTCVMEINIAVSLGPDRTPHASVIANNFPSKPPVIRSTANFDDVSYFDLNFQSPERTAQLATDGIMHPSSSSRNSLGFQQKATDE
jgi:hypothetical protein